MKTQFLSAAKKLFLLLGVWMNVLPAMRAQELGESCYYYLGDYPASKPTLGWQEDVQGVAHDEDHWFITRTDIMWKIPVGHDLDYNRDPSPVPTVSIGDVTQLREEGYIYWGDPECYERRGQTFLLVPVYGGPGGPPHPAIALFRADLLAYVDTAVLNEQSGAPWCAVDPQGNVYSSNFDVDSDNPIHKYTVDWDRVIDSGEFGLSLTNQIPLKDESGTVMSLPRVQGGVIPPNGMLIYLVAGFFDQLLSTDGIHVFDLGSGRRVRRSTLGFGSFNFEFYPGMFEPAQEPEGLTFWDLDDGRAPGISGQLHVLLLDNDAAGADDVFFKHYTGTLHVDRSYSDTEIGSLREPFNTVNEANDLIWDGAQIKISSGSYPEALTFSKRMAVVPSGGPVTIGR